MFYSFKPSALTFLVRLFNYLVKFDAIMCLQALWTVVSEAKGREGVWKV